MRNGTFIYALCNNTHLENRVSTLNCRVAIESAESSSSRSCNVTLRNIVDSITGVSLLSPDKAVLLWTSDKSPEYPYGARVINVLDFKDSCRLYETRLRHSAKNITLETRVYYYTPIVPYDDGTFDAFYDNGNVWKKGRLCKDRFNDKAEKIGEEVPWVDIASVLFIGISSVWPRSSAYGYVFKEHGDEYSQVSYVDTKGHYIPLRYYTWLATPGASRLIHSTANNLLTICQNTPATCEQLDLANNHTVLIPPYITDPELPIPATSYKFPTFTVYSLRGGGFLYLQDTHVYRFDAKGQKAGSVVVESLDCKLDKDILVTNVFEKYDGRYCFYSMCYDGDRIQVHGNVRFGFVCFSDENFL